LKVGIVGLPGAGKTTLFRALTGLPSGETRKPLLGVIKVPDARIDRLSAIYKPKKTTYAEISFVDFPGPADAAAGHALDAQGIAAMREVDALCQVVRGYEGGMHADPPNPLAEAKALWAELLLSDQSIVEKRIERLRKDRSNPRELELQEKCLATLETERPLSSLALAGEEAKLVSGFRYLTQKPLLTVLNIGEEALGKPVPKDLEAAATTQGALSIALSCKVEMEVTELPEAEQKGFLEALGLAESARTTFIRSAYRLLDLISFFTTGEDEVRAWTIRRGTPAVRAAGKIHSDIERGFIRAEVVHYDDRIALGSDAKCREAGKLRLEGKEYVVEDGDIVHFRHSS
jgi:GTP-binding protein YchF